ncbi:Cyclic AMP-responsive element-binding protein 5 [Diplodia seriata]|uniref:Cyclic AMP-responsive element-binding protein 5 n=1 Tax=Diplodia seriata TaxID=420778 RepID=A0A1S8BN45_9PEZI|nr:Cyclic AMP-responsive element-binding protein 5 [Diplodia seriata]
MASMIDEPMALGPPCEAFCDAHDAADPTLLANPLANFLDNGAFSRLFNASRTAGYVQQGTLGPDSGSDLTRHDSLLPDALASAGWEAGDGRLHTPSDDTKSQQRTSESTEPSEPTIKRRTPRKSTKQRRQQVADTPEGRARRETNLEKNRMAANRCRQKRKVWTNRLEDKHRQLAAHNALLRAEVASLYDAVFALKEMALRHADCGSRPIDEYVRLEAERVRDKARRSI